MQYLDIDRANETRLMDAKWSKHERIDIINTKNFEKNNNITNELPSNRYFFDPFNYKIALPILIYLYLDGNCSETICTQHKIHFCPTIESR